MTNFFSIIFLIFRLINNTYYYQEMKEVRYIYSDSIENLEVYVANEKIDYIIDNNIIDLNNYYPLNVVKIKNNNYSIVKISNSLNFDDNYFAYVNYISKDIEIDDWIFYKPKYRIKKSNNLLVENRILKKL